jgi:hypothetical protein
VSDARLNVFQLTDHALQNYNKVVIYQTFAVNICEYNDYSRGMQTAD